LRYFFNALRYDEEMIFRNIGKKSGPSSKRKTMVALYNNGGGMRGLIPAHLMAYIEDVTGLRMTEMIDIFAGPSTGSILNAALTRRSRHDPDKPMYKARNLIRFYERDGLKIFPPDRFRAFRGMIHDFNNRSLKIGQLNSLLRHGHYNPDNLARSLRALLGNAKLEDSLRTLIIPTYNIDGKALIVEGQQDETVSMLRGGSITEGGHAVWLKNVVHDHPYGAKEQTPDVSLYEAVMASCAAPTFFPCFHMSVNYPGTGTTREYATIDGQIFDNPCVSYLGAIKKHVPEDCDLIMIVLGTGYTNRSIRKEEWNSYGPLGIVDPVNDLPLINIFFHATESALFDSFEEELGDNLFLFNKSMLGENERHLYPNPQIDDASESNMMKMERFAQSMIEENQARFDTLCDILVRNYESRQR